MIQVVTLWRRNSACYTSSKQPIWEQQTDTKNFLFHQKIHFVMKWINSLVYLSQYNNLEMTCSQHLFYYFLFDYHIIVASPYNFCCSKTFTNFAANSKHEACNKYGKKRPRKLAAKTMRHMAPRARSSTFNAMSANNCWSIWRRWELETRACMEDSQPDDIWHYDFLLIKEALSKTILLHQGDTIIRNNFQPVDNALSFRRWHYDVNRSTTENRQYIYLTDVTLISETTIVA